MFSAYETIAAGRYRERFGLAFEEFEVGQRFRHRPGLTLSQQDNKDEALDTLNQAMLHYDAAYAAATIVTRGANQLGEVVCAMTYTALVERGGLAPAAQQDSDDERLASHRAIAPSVYLEQIGLAFEDLRPGETWEHRPGKTFFAEESVRQALRALEQSPRLTEANRERHGGRLAINEVYVVGAVTALTTKTLGKVVANLGWKDVQLPHPVRDGDTVYAESTILDTRASQSRPTQGIAHVATRAFNQDRRLVCTYERRLLVYRQGQGGY